MIICIKATKVADSLLEFDNGNLFPIYPDTFYNKGTKGYWMLKQIGYQYQIIKYLKG